MGFMRSSVFVLAIVSLTACANDGLRQLRSTGNGPDDFIVNPTKPLEEPTNFAELPTPTPGQGNLVDPTPLQDGVAVLGGRLGNPNGAVPGVDGALVQHAGRFGVNSAIRGTLAEEDANFRRRQARFTQIRIVPVDRYNEAYRRSALDAVKAAKAYRKAGIPTPTAPLSN